MLLPRAGVRKPSAAAALGAALHAGRARLGDARRKLAQVPAGVRGQELEQSRKWRAGSGGSAAAVATFGQRRQVEVVVCCYRCGWADHEK
jgi:hypothetical protein